MKTFELNLVTYNPVKSYFNEALKSLEKVSDIKELNIVIWDNGSETDFVKEATKEICKKINVSYEKIEKNDGKAPAVFDIFYNSKSDYIMFMNDDDILSKDNLDSILNKIRNMDKDIYILDYLYLDDTNKKEKVKKVIRGKNREIKEIPKYTWTIDLNCIYKTKFVQESGIEFSHDIKFYEDIYNNMLFFSKTNNIYYVDEWFYKYRIKRKDQGNVSSVKNIKKNIDQLIKVRKELKEIEIIYNKKNVNWRISLLKWPIILFGRKYK